MAREYAKLKDLRSGIDQPGDAFAGSETIFFMLRFDSFGATALADLLFLSLEGGEKFDHGAGVLLEVRGLGVDAGFQDREDTREPR